MSPEQALGDSEVDGRSDLYSLGCVLYEMLVGDPPFLGHNSQQILARHVMDPVPSPRTVRAAVPPRSSVRCCRRWPRPPPIVTPPCSSSSRRSARPGSATRR